MEGLGAMKKWILILLNAVLAELTRALRRSGRP